MDKIEHFFFFFAFPADFRDFKQCAFHWSSYPKKIIREYIRFLCSSSIDLFDNASLRPSQRCKKWMVYFRLNNGFLAHITRASCMISCWIYICHQSQSAASESETIVKDLKYSFIFFSFPAAADVSVCCVSVIVLTPSENTSVASYCP